MAQLKIDLIVDDKGSIVVKQFAGNVTKNLDTAGGSFDGFARRVGLAGAALTGLVGGVGSIVGLVGGRGLQVFSDLEAKLIGVQKTTDFSAAEMKLFGDSITDMGRRLPVATGSLLEIAGVAGQLGIKGVDNITGFTEVMGKLTLATDVAGAEGAADIARLLNVTGEGVETIETFGAVLVGLGNNSAATESEILNMATQIGQATGVFGVGSTEALAMGAAMRSIGVQAELGGSVVGRSMRAIEAAISAGGDELTRLSQVTGIAEKDLKRAFGDNATQVFQKFLQGIGSMIAGGKTAAESLEMFGLKGDEVLKVLPTMAVNTKIFDNAQRLANEEVRKGTALNNEAAKAGEGLGAQLLRVGNVTTEMASSIGEQLAPHAKDLVGVFVDWWEVNDKLVTQNVSGFIGGISDASKTAYETTKGLTTGIVDLENASQSFIDTAFGIAGPDALDWGIIGAVLFKGGPGAAGIAAALVTVNNQLELLGKNSVLRLPDMSLGSLPDKLMASGEAFSLAFEGLYGKRDSSTGELLSEIEQIDRKIKSLQDTKEPWQLFPDPSETKRRAAEVKAELASLEQQRAKLVQASREQSMLYVDPWQVNAGAAAQNNDRKTTGTGGAVMPVMPDLPGKKTALDAAAKKEAKRVADLMKSTAATEMQIGAMNGLQNAKVIDKNGDVKWKEDSWMTLIDLSKKYNQTLVDNKAAELEWLKQEELSLQANKSVLQQWAESTTTTMDLMTNVATSSSDSISGAFVDAMWDLEDSTKSAKDTFLDFASSTLRETSKMIAQQMLLNSVKSGMQANGWINAGLSIVGGLFGMSGGMDAGASAAASLSTNLGAGTATPAILNGAAGYHNGGVVGSEPSFYRNLPRYHNGLVPGESLAILKDDETVFTEGQMARLGKGLKLNTGGGSSPIVNNTFNITIDRGAGGSDADKQSFANQIAQTIKQEVKGIIGEERRYGGLLYRGI